MREELGFSIGETHGHALLPQNRLLASSDGLGWTAAFVSRQHEAPARIGFEARPDVLIRFVLVGRGAVSRAMNGAEVMRQAYPGTMMIVPPAVAHVLAVQEPCDTLILYIRRALVEEAAAEIGMSDPRPIRIVARFCTTDPLLERLALLLIELARERAASSRPMADRIARSVAARLVAEHAHPAAPALHERGRQGLSRRHERRLREFVDTRLAYPIALDDLARETGLSTPQFARLFKRSFGVTAYQYVIGRRVAHAQRLLSETALPISEIGLAAGFFDQAHLNRHFCKLLGHTPADYRRRMAL